MAGTIVSWRSRVQTDRTDKWLYQSIRSDKDFTIDRPFLYRSSPTPMTFVSLRLMDNYQRPGRSSITIPETLGSLIGDFVFSRASVENCFHRFVYCFDKSAAISLQKLARHLINLSTLYVILKLIILLNEENNLTLY